MRAVDVVQRATRQTLVTRARWGDTFFARLRGLMFRRQLEPGEALVIVEPRESRAATSIHMFFVPFPIAAVWINNAGQVVDKALALPWKPYYAARVPARYVLETHPAFLDHINIGDAVDFVDAV